jgi:hypothetical protein
MPEVRVTSRADVRSESTGIWGEMTQGACRRPSWNIHNISESARRGSGADGDGTAMDAAAMAAIIDGIMKMTIEMWQRMVSWSSLSEPS